MRWKRPARGDTRYRTRFLFFPKTIDRKVRWWEKATWKEEYGGIYALYWFALRWIDT